MRVFFRCLGSQHIHKDIKSSAYMGIKSFSGKQALKLFKDVHISVTSSTLYSLKHFEAMYL